MRDWVARIPSVSQSSATTTRPADSSSRGTNAKTMRGASGEVVSMPCRPSCVQAGASEVKILVPLNA